MSKERLVLGLDPAKKYIPDCYINDNRVDLISWGKDIIKVCEPYCLGVKLQSAYFENYGLYGLECLSTLIFHIKEKGLCVIMDGKRGDIGSTSSAYATAYLASKNEGGNSDFESDFLTVNPLMGEDCLEPFVETAVSFNKGLFVLLETSNPGADMILKERLLNNQQVNEKIAHYINLKNNQFKRSSVFGPIGCVIGATNPNGERWREKLPNSIFLMPGMGAQGGDWSNIKACMTKDGKGVWIPISRGITMPKNNSISNSEFLEGVYKKVTNISNEMNRYLGN